MKCLIVDDMHSSFMTMLKELGMEADYCPDINREEILRRIEDYEGLVIRSKTVVDKELIDAGKRLDFIGRAGAGLDNLNINHLNERGIKVFNAGEGNCDAVGDHTVGMVLSLLKNISKSNMEVRAGQWIREGNRGRELSSMVVGIIGYGNTGKAVAKRLSAFGCKVLVYDKYKKGFGGGGVKEMSLSEILNNADIITLHLPLTDETRNLVNKGFIGTVRKEFYLINTSRGEIVDTKGLIEGLNSGKIKGAALDVFEKEGRAFIDSMSEGPVSELLKNKNIIFTPHIAGWSVESYERISKTLFDKIKACFFNNCK